MKEKDDPKAKDKSKETRQEHPNYLDKTIEKDFVLSFPDESDLDWDFYEKQHDDFYERYKKGAIKPLGDV